MNIDRPILGWVALCVIASFLVAIMYTGCTAIDERRDYKVRFSLPEEVSQLTSGDNVIVKSDTTGNVITHDIGIYHGGPIAPDEEVWTLK